MLHPCRPPLQHPNNWPKDKDGHISLFFDVVANVSQNKGTNHGATKPNCGCLVWVYREQRRHELVAPLANPRIEKTEPMEGRAVVAHFVCVVDKNQRQDSEMRWGRLEGSSCNYWGATSSFLNFTLWIKCHVLSIISTKRNKENNEENRTKKSEKMSTYHVGWGKNHRG